MLKEGGWFFITLFFLVVITSFVSASNSTIVIGKVYQQNLSNPSSGATVTVYCWNNSSVFIQTSISLADGTYGVFFDGNCSLGDILNATATNGDYYGEDYGTVNVIGDPNFALLNVVMQYSPSPLIPVKEQEVEECAPRVMEYPYLCGDGYCNSEYEDSFNCNEDCVKTKIRHNPSITLEHSPMKEIKPTVRSWKFNVDLGSVVFLSLVILIVLVIILVILIYVHEDNNA